jgi:hypothetical protein
MREIKDCLRPAIWQIYWGLSAVMVTPGHLGDLFEFLLELLFADTVFVSAPHQGYEVFIYTYVLY